MQRVNPIRVRRMNQHRTNGHEICQKPRHIDSGSWLNRCAGQRVQIMIERDQRRGPKKRFARGDHGRRIAPELHFKAVPQPLNSLLKRRDALVVIFENEYGFHNTSTPFRSAMPMVACVPELNSKKSFSMPSLKITPFSGMRDSRIKGVSAVTRPNTSDAPVVFVGNGSRTV